MHTLRQINTNVESNNKKITTALRRRVQNNADTSREIDELTNCEEYEEREKKKMCEEPNEQRLHCSMIFSLLPI